MNGEKLKQDARLLITDLLHLDYSQTEKIVEVSQKLNSLCLLDEDNNSCALTGLLMATIMLGERKKALDINEQIWQKGETLSDFFQLIYLDNLVNLGEIEPLKMFLEPRLNCIGDNLKHFYSIFVRYALLSGDLALLVRISEYENLPIKENGLFSFANKNAFKFATLDYKYILKTILKNLKNDLCAFDYGFYQNGEIELIFYTPHKEIRNAALRKAINKNIDDYFEKEDRSLPYGFNYKIENIAKHTAWIK